MTGMRSNKEAHIGDTLHVATATGVQSLAGLAPPKPMVSSQRVNI